MPVLGIGGAHSLADQVADTMKLAADDVQTLVIPGCAHWVAEETPEETLAALTAFLAPYRDEQATAHTPGPQATVFPGCFANGLPAGAGAVLAATQRPLATSTFTDQSGVPAWQTIPSWDVVGTADHIITPAEQLFMANRAHAHITQINAPHLSMITDPGVVASVIIQAAQATG